MYSRLLGREEWSFQVNPDELGSLRGRTVADSLRSCDGNANGGNIVRDEVRQVCGDSCGGEEAISLTPLVLGCGSEVDSSKPVDLDIDETGYRQAAVAWGKTHPIHNTLRDADVASNVTAPNYGPDDP